MILSFAYTTPQFLAGIKTVTRRKWSGRYLRAWQNAWDEGRLEHDAVNKNMRAGGKRIGRFRLTARPYLEALKDMPDADLALEGFPEFERTQRYIDFMKADPDEVFAVIRFEKMLDAGSSPA